MNWWILLLGIAIGIFIGYIVLLILLKSIGLFDTPYDIRGEKSK